jgi:glycosyltransferase involved in cell wall biosynthesis
VRILRELRDNDAQAARLRSAARAWVEREFDAHKNAARLATLYAV